MKSKIKTTVSYRLKATAAYGEFFAQIVGNEIVFGRLTDGDTRVMSINHLESRQFIHMLLKARKLADASRPD